MHHILWHFSVWEVAHRWHGYDPNLTSELTLPLDVQDTIRLLCKLITRLDIDICNDRGIQLKNPDRFPDWDEYEKNELLRINDSIKKSDNDHNELRPIEHDDKIYDQYCKELDNWSKPRELLTDGIEVTFLERTYPKDLLEKIHLSVDEIEFFCQLVDYDLPTFLFSEQQIKEFRDKYKTKTTQGGHDENEINSNDSKIEATDGSNNSPQIQKNEFSDTPEIPKSQKAIDEQWSKLQPKQSTRLICRHIASQLWDMDASITIEQMKMHDAIQIYGGAKFYSGRNTVRDWLKDLAPNRNPGRPRNKDL